MTYRKNGMRARVIAPLLALVSAAIVSLPGNAGAQSWSIEGCWHVEIDMPFPKSDKKLAACFEKNGAGLVGKVRRDAKGPWKAISSVSQTGTTFSFVTPSEDGPVTFQGAFESNSKLKGNVKASRGARPFSAERTGR